MRFARAQSLCPANHSSAGGESISSSRSGQSSSLGVSRRTLPALIRSSTAFAEGDERGRDRLQLSSRFFEAKSRCGLFQVDEPHSRSVLMLKGNGLFFRCSDYGSEKALHVLEQLGNRDSAMFGEVGSEVAAMSQVELPRAVQVAELKVMESDRSLQQDPCRNRRSLRSRPPTIPPRSRVRLDTPRR